MKKAYFITLAIVLSGLCGSAAAQDIILKLDTEEIEARIIEIKEGEIRYRKWSNPDGPIYSMKRSDIFLIRYENGEKEVFTTEVAQEPEATNNDYPYPTVSGSYAIGDYFHEDGVEGIVFYTTDQGRHGLIVALKPLHTLIKHKRSADFHWSNQNESIGATDRDDGWLNRQAIERFIRSELADWSDFPIFKSAANQKAGWYIPAMNEAVVLIAAFNGGAVKPANTEARRRFSKRFKQYGGEFSNSSYYTIGTSTECGDTRFYCISTHDGKRSDYEKDSHSIDLPIYYLIHKF